MTRGFGEWADCDDCDGRCNADQGRGECPRREVEPDLPINVTTLAIAAAVIALVVWISSHFPMGFAA